LVALLVIVFFIPNVAFIGFGWIALIGSGFFILIQLILLVDFAHSWSESWVKNYQESEENKNCWAFGLLGSTFVMYALSLSLTIVMYIFFLGDKPGCSVNVTFISLNLIFNFFAGLISIHPKLQEKNPRIGLLQSSVVCLYSTFLIWSSLTSEPASMGCSTMTIGSTTGGDGFSLFFGVGLTFFALIYTALRVSSSGDSLSEQTGTGDSATKELMTAVSVSSEEEGDVSIERTVKKHHKQETIQKEEIEEVESDAPVDYNYSFFHVTFLMAALYLGMVLTNWETVTSLTGDQVPPDSIFVDQGMAAVWVKVVSAWLTIGLYIWTLFAPLCFPDRKFY